MLKLSFEDRVPTKNKQTNGEINRKPLQPMQQCTWQSNVPYHCFFLIMCLISQSCPISRSNKKWLLTKGSYKENKCQISYTFCHNSRWRVSIRIGDSKNYNKCMSKKEKPHKTQKIMHILLPCIQLFIKFHKNYEIVWKVAQSVVQGGGSNKNKHTNRENNRKPYENTYLVKKVFLLFHFS